MIPLKQYLRYLHWRADLRWYRWVDYTISLRRSSRLIFCIFQNIIVNIFKSPLQYIRECQPYALTTDVHLHTNYIQNILRVTEYIESDEDARTVILSILTERLVQLDAHIDKSDEDEVKLCSWSKLLILSKRILKSSLELINYNILMVYILGGSLWFNGGQRH